MVYHFTVKMVEYLQCGSQHKLVYNFSIYIYILPMQ